MYNGQCHTSIPFVGPHCWLNVLVSLCFAEGTVLLSMPHEATSNNYFDEEVQALNLFKDN